MPVWDTRICINFALGIKIIFPEIQFELIQISFCAVGTSLNFHPPPPKNQVNHIESIIKLQPKQNKTKHKTNTLIHFDYIEIFSMMIFMINLR